MHGDFSSWTFDPLRRYSRVLQQQGRVQLDADANEAGAVLLHAVRTLARDVIGAHGGPGESFRIGPADGAHNDLEAAAGHYYVDGVLCEADVPLRYGDQVDHPDAPDLEAGSAYLVYLDVWERWLSSVHVPELREVALGGTDTAGRARVVHQLRAEPIDDPGAGAAEQAFTDLLARLQPAERGLLRARARVDDDDVDPCITPPSARYRGPENQLYRVEVFAAGDPAAQEPATFVWSRDNGAVAFALTDLDADAGSGRSTLAVDGLAPDVERGLAPGQWVEVRDDVDDLEVRPRRLHRILSVDVGEARVVVDGVPDLALRFSAGRRPLVRRWDQDGDPDLGGAIAVRPERWQELEDGVQVQLSAGQQHRADDHWLIPARTIPGDVLWPLEDGGGPAALPPHGVTHRYAPLATVQLDGAGALQVVEEMRRGFTPLGER